MGLVFHMATQGTENSAPRAPSALCSPGVRQPLESPAPAPTSPERPFPTNEVPAQKTFAFPFVPFVALGSFPKGEKGNAVFPFQTGIPWARF